MKILALAFALTAALSFTSTLAEAKGHHGHKHHGHRHHMHHGHGDRHHHAGISLHCTINSSQCRPYRD